MAGLTKEQAAKKGPKKASLHTEPIHDLPKAVDWEEQERIKASLKGKFIPEFRANGSIKKTAYSPERAAELCIMRRGGLNLRQVSERAGTNYATIKGWLADYPEFAQEWDGAYTDYITDLAEEIPSIAENLLKDLKRDGRKLSPKQFGRYLRAVNFLAEQTQFAATKRARTLYGDSEGGMELVLVQPTDIPARAVTQDTARAEAWKIEAKEAEDAEVSLSDSGVADGTGGGEPRQIDSGGDQPLDDGAEHKKPGPKRRNKGGNSRVAKPAQPKPDEEPGPSVD